jgi:uncharacterized protein YndB with AHSA1/START domain
MIAELKKDGNIELELRRRFPFPRKMVFEAWVNKDHLVKWMGPTPDINLAVTEIDAAVGGSYRFGFEERNCSDGISYVHGEYIEISPYDKLAFTWIWEAPLEEAGVETLVTVEFFETDSGTEILLTHQRFATEEACEKHRMGWGGTFDKLNNRLPEISKQGV